MKKLLIIDRDGTLIKEPEDYQVDSFEKLVFMPGVFTWLGRIARELDYELIMATNQDGLGTDSFPEEDFKGPQQLLLQTLAGEGIRFSDLLIDPSFDHQNRPTRKPGTGMFGKYMEGNYDLASSYVIGDRITDVQLAENLGAKAILFKQGEKGNAILATTSWEEIYYFLKPARKAVASRKTKETDIRVMVDLDNPSDADIQTGIGFLDHMLEQVARHAEIGLNVNCQGDLHIDEHHTAEDVAITLGQALKKALGNKAGIGRYGFALPMDDCEAKVLLDLGGRPFFLWKAKFKREKIGDMATELLPHFFQSLSYGLEANIHIKAKGNNEHHKAEAIFKAFARALKQATRLEGTQLPTTKGVI